MRPMRRKLVPLPLWLAVLVSFPGSLSAAPFAYITNNADDTVSVVDTATNVVTATVSVGSCPNGVAVIADGTRAYVTDVCSASVSVLDTATNAVIATVPVGASPDGLAVTPDGRYVYVANWGSHSVSVIERASNTVIGTTPVANFPYGVAITPDGTRVYVASVGSDAVSVLDTATNAVIATVPVGASPQGLAVTPDGRYVYVANWHSYTVSVISTGDNTVSATVRVGPSPNGVAVTPDGTRVYVTHWQNSTVSVITTATNTVTATVSVELEPAGVAVHPDGTRAYVVNHGSGTVSVIDAISNSVIDTVAVGSQPTALGRFIGPDVRDRVGVYRPSDGTFYLDYLGNGAVEGCAADRCLSIGRNGDVPLVGDWNGSGTGKVGLFRPSGGEFYLDYDGSGTWSGCSVDRCLQIGLNGDIPVVGDWNGSGPSKVGTFRPSDGMFYLDYNGNGTWDGCGVDRCLQIGLSGDIPLVGNWNATSVSKVGTFRPSDGMFYLDYNGNGIWDGCAADRCFQIGLGGDVPLVGKWDGSGTSKVGVFRPSDGTFYLDYNGSGTWDGCGTDQCFQIGLSGDIPLVGDWNGSGTSKVGTFRPSDGTFYLDSNGNGVWDGCGPDQCLKIGLNGDIPVVGKW